MKILEFPLRSGQQQKGLILVGRDALSNDELSMNIAKANDIWFHASDFPGAHVVLQGSDDMMDIIQAAELAMFYSKDKGMHMSKNKSNSKNKSGVVSYCFAHQVSKAKYTNAGQVVISGETRSIRVHNSRNFR